MRPCFLRTIAVGSLDVRAYPLDHHVPCALTQVVADQIDPCRWIHHNAVVQHTIEEFHYSIVFQLAALHHTPHSLALTIKAPERLP